MNAKAISLFLLRFSTGIYLVLWAFRNKFNGNADGMSDRFYGGIISGDTIWAILGGLEAIVGLLVVLGLFRSISYLGQLVWYFVGIVPIMVYIIDPLGIYIADQSRMTWFPSTTLLFASIVIIVFKEYDTISLDHKRGK